MNMYEMIKSFPSQIQTQYASISNIDMDFLAEVDHIIVSGMGGSAISGDIALNMFKDYLSVPITVLRDYSLPKWVNNKSLVILSSYSGNTEETLSVANQAIEKELNIISITTGGKLLEISREHNIQSIEMPTGYQPRAAIGFSLTSLLVILEKGNFLNKDIVREFIDSSEEVELFFYENCGENQWAYNIAKEISAGVIAIYGTRGNTDAIASRFQAQISENSKYLSSWNHLPELNHNEIEGWSSDQFGEMKKYVIWLYDEHEHDRVHKRIKVTSEILSEININNIFIKCDGSSSIVRQLKLIQLVDMVSYYLAIIAGIDPVPVDRIMTLKDRMSR